MSRASDATSTSHAEEGLDATIELGTVSDVAEHLLYSQEPSTFESRNLSIQDAPRHISSQGMSFRSPTSEGPHSFSMTQIANALPLDPGHPSMQYHQGRSQVPQAACYDPQAHLYTTGPHIQYHDQYGATHDANRYTAMLRQQMYHGAPMQSMYPQYPVYGAQPTPYFPQHQFIPTRQHQQYAIPQPVPISTQRDRAMGWPGSSFSPTTSGNYSSSSFTPPTPLLQTVVGDAGSSRTGATAGSSSLTTLKTRIPRGPPRKPRQSGHALWVGNLPPRATVTDLKDHFSREATNDIMSLKLISKSNCAFVNYKTHEACTAAMARFHDSRFHGMRLVCRLRRASNNNSPVTPLSATTMTTEDPIERVDDEEAEESLSSVGGASSRKQSVSRMPERYFVLKSLTMHDLDASVRNGVWATQSHNEQTLSEAFENTDNVYLIFSVNKSGEYYGFARMVSSIRSSGTAEATTSPITAPSIASASAEIVGPRSIPTPATRWAPTGKIIDDSARGTIFWEADGLEDVPDAPEPPLTASSVPKSEPHTPGVEANPVDRVQESEEIQQSLGKTFHVEWVSARRVPFYKTRGIRNPWNSNREIKIARDGTELEPSVGRKLVGFFGVPGFPS